MKMLRISVTITPGCKNRPWADEMGAMMRFPIVSLKDPTVIRRIMREMGRDSKVRNQVFREIAQNPKLQREILATLAKHAPARRKFIVELANSLQIRRAILELAGENKP